MGDTKQKKEQKKTACLEMLLKARKADDKVVWLGEFLFLKEVI